MFGKNSIRIGKIFGINIEINYTWPIIFFIVWLGLSLGFLPQFYSFSTATNFIVGGITSIALFASVILHELSHSLVARRAGITINSITLFVFGGVAQIEEEPKTPRTELKMALSGPIFSLVLAGVCILALYLIPNLPEYIQAPFIILAQLNFVLGLFNLLPGFPLDGGRALRAILWHYNNDLLKSTRASVVGGQVIAFFLASFGFLSIIFGNFGGIWLILIGAFLYQAGQASLTETKARVTLEDIKVEDLMNKEPVIVPEDMNAREFAEDFFLKENIHSALVADEKGDVVGFVDIDTLDAVRLKDWEKEKISNLAVRYEKSDYVTREEPAIDALNKMRKREETILPVLESGRLVGSLTKENLSNFLKLQT